MGRITSCGVFVLFLVACARARKIGKIIYYLLQRFIIILFICPFFTMKVDVLTLVKFDYMCRKFIARIPFAINVAVYHVFIFFF